MGLLPDWKEEDESIETDLNFLMMTALDKITFLPFGFLMDKYRWKVFREEVKPEGYQALWDKLRLKYQVTNQIESSIKENYFAFSFLI